MAAAAALVMASSCGGGGLEGGAKQIAAIVCKAKGVDEAKAKELQAEIKTVATILQGKMMEEAKAQKEKTPEEFMKEAGKKFEELISAEAQKSCGVTQDEIDNFMRGGKLEKSNYGPHVEEIKGMTPDVFMEKDSAKMEQFTKVTDTDVTIWKINYAKKGKVFSTEKQVVKFADIDLAMLGNDFAPKAQAPIIYTEGSFELSFFSKKTADVFVTETFRTNKALETNKGGYGILSFKTMAAAQAVADKIKATATAAPAN